MTKNFDKSFPKLSLLKIFIHKPGYYKYLLRLKKIDVRAAYFLALYNDEIYNLLSPKKTITDINHLKELIGRFQKEYDIEKITWDQIDTESNKIITIDWGKESADNPPVTVFDAEYTVQDPRSQNIRKIMQIGKSRFAAKVVYCPYDADILTLSEVVAVCSDSCNPIAIPYFKCRICDRNYTVIDNEKDLQTIKVQERTYINISDTVPNLSERPDILLKPFRPNTRKVRKSFVKRPGCVVENLQLTKCENGDCKGVLLKANLRTQTKKSKICYVKLKFCPICGTFYMLNNTFNNYRDVFYDAHKQTFAPPFSHDETESGHAKISGKHPITIKDFVIRRSVNSCIYREHKIENIDAVVDMIAANGNTFQKIIGAGYCSTCNLYFISEETFKDLRRIGVPLCKVTDEETYKKEKENNSNSVLASESILKMLGYSVSQKDNLTDWQRRKILTEVIDNGICSKHKVLSLLRFFITMHISTMYDLATSKWESDMDYIEKYRVGEFRKVKVGSIRNKR